MPENQDNPVDALRGLMDRAVAGYDLRLANRVYQEYREHIINPPEVAEQELEAQRERARRYEQYLRAQVRLQPVEEDEWTRHMNRGPRQPPLLLTREEEMRMARAGRYQPRHPEPPPQPQPIPRRDNWADMFLSRDQQFAMKLESLRKKE